MKQQDCIDTIGQVPRLPAEPPTLGRLWLVCHLRRLPEPLLIWLERSRQRRQISQMDDRMLRDIGVSRGAAFAESQKWFWQP